MKTEKRPGGWQKALYICLLICYIGLHFLLITRHEAFRDEAQAWTLAGNTTMKELFGALPIEGHPCLWFLLIRPLAKLGFSYRYFGYISLAVMSVCAVLLLWKAPFGDLLKAITLFSFAFCYNSPVMPRTYCVITLLILLLAMLWKDRLRKPVLYGFLIALLFQSHIILAGFAGGLVLELFLNWVRKENRNGKVFCGILLPCLSALCTGLELYQPAGSKTFVDATSTSLLAKISFDAQKILNSVYDLEEDVWGHYVCEAEIGPVTGKTLLLLIFFVLLAALFCTAVFGKQGKGAGSVLLVAVCGFGFALGVRLFVYSGGHHMTVCYFLMLLFLCWALAATVDDRAVRAISGVILALALLLTYEKWINAAKYEISHAFSGSLPTAEFMESEIPEGGAVAVREHYLVPSVYAYVASDRKDITFKSVDTKEPYKFHTWLINDPTRTPEELAEEARELFPEEKDLYYLSCEELPESEAMELLYCFAERNPLEENYWFYRVTDRS